MLAKCKYVVCCHLILLAGCGSSVEQKSAAEFVALVEAQGFKDVEIGAGFPLMSKDIARIRDTFVIRQRRIAVDENGAPLWETDENGKRVGGFKKTGYPDTHIFIVEFDGGPGDLGPGPPQITNGNLVFSTADDTELGRKIRELFEAF